MKDFNLVLILFHNKMDDHRSDLLRLLDELGEQGELNSDKSLTEYTKLLYLNYISLSELQFIIKEHFFLNNIVLL
jgi:hypothetical protein